MSMKLLPMLEQFSIVPKGKPVARFRPNRCQRRIVSEVENAYNQGEPCRLIVLKARQVGISTVSEAILFAWTLKFPDITCVVAAHDLQGTHKLFDMTRLFYETYPLKARFPTRYASVNRIVFRNNRSGIHVITASKRTAGRGWTPMGLHASEHALWPYPEETWTSLRNGVPNRKGSLIIIESTARGMGNLFEHIWRQSESGVSEYKALFFPWYEHHEYIPCQGIGCEDATCETCEAWGSGITPRNDDERELTQRILQSGGHPKPLLAWRRWAIENHCFGSEDMFHQEYPSTAEEAFIASGVAVFPEDNIRQCFEELPHFRGDLREDPTGIGKARLEVSKSGPLRIYRKPHPSQTYFIGADSCFGHGPDLAAAHVINRKTKEQVAVYHAKINPIAFADELARLGAYYNYAMVAPEVEGPGQATVARLMSIYTNVWTQAYADKVPGRDQSFIQAGWSTNWRRKAWLLAQLANALERGQVVLHDRPTLTELRQYCYAGGKGYEFWGNSDPEGHDDLVMSLGITLICESTDPGGRTSPVKQALATSVRFGSIDGKATVWAEPEEESVDSWQG